MSKLTDLNDRLFDSLERLLDEKLSEEELAKEIKRCDMVTKVATTIIQNGELALKTVALLNEYGIETPKNSLPPLLLN